MPVPSTAATGGPALWLARACAWAERLAIMMLFVMTALIIAQVVARNLLDLGWPWAEELARYAGLGLVYLAAPLLLLHNKHIQVDIISARIRGLAGRWLNVVNEALVLAFCVLYALFLGTVVYRELTWKSLVDAARETVQSTASVLFIVASAALFAWVLTIDRIPTMASEFLLDLTRNPVLLLLMVNGILLVVGMVMESIAAILILAPIFTPALMAAGVDPIQLGVVVVLNLLIR